MKYDTLTIKQQQLNKQRPLPDALVCNLDDWFRVELTYTSNAIEGNTLTRKETALVVEKGLTVGGKTLTEHLEATNHAKALDWVSEQITRSLEQITEKDILKIHEMILKGVDDYNAGHYRSVQACISGSVVILPNAKKVPDLMKDFVKWIKDNKDIHPVELASEIHYRLVTIHPFVDGNGRTARLLMNMVLMMLGYPPAIIRKSDRLAYISALEKAQLGGSKGDYNKIIGKAVERSLDIYLKALKGDSAEPVESDVLLKIGQLAKQAGVNTSTIRYWTKEGLLSVAEITEAGYQMYSTDMIARIQQIQQLKNKRFTLQEIKGEI